MRRDETILLVEDNPDDELLTRRDLVDRYGLGANGYARKPLDLTQFRAAVQKLGLYWVVLNEVSRV